jgi:hypothetical protein
MYIVTIVLYGMVMALYVQQLLRLLVHACQLYKVKDTFQTGEREAFYLIAFLVATITWHQQKANEIQE